MDHIGILYVICTYIVYIHMKNQNSEIYYKGAGEDIQPFPITYIE